jgi:hypothetical protein
VRQGRWNVSSLPNHCSSESSTKTPVPNTLRPSFPPPGKHCRTIHVPQDVSFPAHSLPSGVLSFGNSIISCHHHPARTDRRAFRCCPDLYVIRYDVRFCRVRFADPRVPSRSCTSVRRLRGISLFRSGGLGGRRGSQTASDQDFVPSLYNGPSTTIKTRRLKSGIGTRRPVAKGDMPGEHAR